MTSHKKQSFVKKVMLEEKNDITSFVPYNVKIKFEKLVCLHPFSYHL